MCHCRLILWLGCRHACFGSAEASLPALLPFIACLPRSLQGPTPAVLAQVELSAHSDAFPAPCRGPSSPALQQLQGE